MTADKDQEFSAYMAARQPALLRTAYLLAGDRSATARRWTATSAGSWSTREDDSTLLASLVDGDQHRVVRLGLDGSVEIVAGPITHDPYTPAYRLSPARTE